jgi:putative heme-binding domain-containing protein
MADRTDANMTICAQLLERAPNADTVKHLLRGMELALQGMAIDSVPAEFDAVFSRLWKKYPSDQQLISFALRLNSQEALKVARATIIDTSRPEAERVGYIEKLSQMGDADAELALLKLVGLPAKEASARLRMAALNALRRYSGNGIPAALLGAYDSMEPDLRQTAQSILSSRPSWATQLLEAVDAGKVARESVTFDALLLIQSRGDEKVKAIIKKHWGSLRKPAKEKAARIDAIKKLLAGDGTRGDVARGRTLYTASCAACHKLGDLGRDIAPELTGYERGNLDFLLPAIVDPNLGVREEYELVTLTLRQNGGAEAAETTALTGFVSDATDQTVTLKDLVGNKTLIAKRDIADQSRAAISVMPEGLLDALTDQQIRDLFAFLQLKEATKN